MKFPRTTRLLTGRTDAAPWLCVLFPLAFAAIFHEFLVLPRGLRLSLPSVDAPSAVAAGEHVFVVAVDANEQLYFENQAVELGIGSGSGVGKPLTTRRQQNHRPGGRRALGKDRFDRPKERLGLHHHPRPAAKGGIVNPPVTIGGEGSKVMRIDARQTGLDRSRHDAMSQRLPDQVWKDRDDVDAESHDETVPEAFTRMKPAFTSTSRMNESTRGSRVSRPFSS